MPIETIEDLRNLLEMAIAEVQEAGPLLQPDAKARILLKAVKVGIKVIDRTSIEQRITALEEAQFQQAGR